MPLYCRLSLCRGRFCLRHKDRLRRTQSRAALCSQASELWCVLRHDSPRRGKKCISNWLKTKHPNGWFSKLGEIYKTYIICPIKERYVNNGTKPDIVNWIICVCFSRGTASPLSLGRAVAASSSETLKSVSQRGGRCVLYIWLIIHWFVGRLAAVRCLANAALSGEPFTKRVCYGNQG